MKNKLLSVFGTVLFLVSVTGIILFVHTEITGDNQMQGYISIAMIMLAPIAVSMVSTANEERRESMKGDEK